MTPVFHYHAPIPNRSLSYRAALPRIEQARTADQQITSTHTFPSLFGHPARRDSAAALHAPWHQTSRRACRTRRAEASSRVELPVTRRSPLPQQDLPNAPQSPALLQDNLNLRRATRSKLRRAATAYERTHRMPQWRSCRTPTQGQTTGCSHLSHRTAPHTARLLNRASK